MFVKFLADQRFMLSFLMNTLIDCCKLISFICIVCCFIIVLHIYIYIYGITELRIDLYRSIKYPVREVDFDRYCDRLIFIGGTWNNFVDVNVLLVTYGPTFLGILLLLHKLFTSCSYCFAAKQNPQNVLFALGIQFPFQESTANVG